MLDALRRARVSDDCLPAGCTRYDRRAPAHYDPEYPAVRHVASLSGEKTTYAAKVVK